MRVKCPNSDIYLDLPGDKMDMKFTCPACKKVHRVTVTITTQGEVSQNPKVTTPQMPKKYATGAYPPVVDIPIDADFILFDANAPHQIGIDLGQAAESVRPPFVDRSMSDRHTEIRRDPPEREDESVSANTPDPADEAFMVPPEAAHNDTPPKPNTHDASEAEKLLSENESTIEEEASASDNSSEPDAEKFTYGHMRSSQRPTPRAPERPRRRRSKVKPLVLVLILAAAAFFGWQEYMSWQNRESLSENMAKADSASSMGQLNSVAASMQQAKDALAKDGEFHTVKNVWNRLAGEYDFIPPLAENGLTAARDKVGYYDAQGEIYNSFREEIANNSVQELPIILADGLEQATARDDAGLAMAMRRMAVDKLTSYARGQNLAKFSPEEVAWQAQSLQHGLKPLLDNQSVSTLDNELYQITAELVANFKKDVANTLVNVASSAESGDALSVRVVSDLRKRLANLPVSFQQFITDPEEMLSPDNLPADASAAAREHLEQAMRLSEIYDMAAKVSRTVLSLTEPNDEVILELAKQAADDNTPSEKLAESAAELIDETRLAGEKLLRQREDLYFSLQSENRRGKINPGTMTAWRIVLAAFGNDKVTIDPERFKYDSKNAEIEFTLADLPLYIKMSEDDFEQTIRAHTNGYTLTAAWSPFFNKPLGWIADLSREMNAAGVDPVQFPNWEAMEGPGSLLAISKPVTISSDSLGAVPAGQLTRKVFYDGKLRNITELPLPTGSGEHAEEFRRVAERLHDAVMADATISQQIRQALKPILMGTYLPIDPRDYFDAAFCRRLIEADYLETYIKPMSDDVKQALTDYRVALGKIEAGYDEFSIELDNGDRLVAVARLDRDLTDGKANDQDSYTGEIIPRYTWRLEKPTETVFYSPMPSRFNYAFMQAEYYNGKHTLRPAGVPKLTEVWHPAKGLLASYKKDADRAEGDSQLWDEAISLDVGGPLNPVYGPPGWNFPLHVLERNDQDDPVKLATLDGVVPSPDFTRMTDEKERREAEDKWLDDTAEILSSPGELGLIFHQFFRYCSDSPLPEHPNLIGSHMGVSDTHQTVYQSLERRWVGRLIGDCDDLAEVFQVLTRKQGKLSYVMNLPAHAACGYVDKKGKDDFQFVVLQTGQVLQFNGRSLFDVVDAAYRSFDRSAGESHLTMDAVPLLLRFADEETRTPFVLSARIYEDQEYADAMIRVQGYWHEHVFSAGIKEMEEMVAQDKEVGSVKELGSLYERVGMYEKSAEMRRLELELVKDNPQAKLSTLLEIAMLHVQDKNKPKALDALHEMEEQMQEFTRNNNVSDFMRAMSFRSQWAILLSRLGEPSRAWELLKYDAEFTKRQQGFIADSVLRTLVIMYDKMSLNRDNPDAQFTDQDRETMESVEKELTSAFQRGVFKDDDNYTQTIIRYYFLGRFAVAREGRDRGLGILNLDGPYPTGAKDQTKRTSEITAEDWSWMRIAPQIYLSYGMEMLDREEFPQLYNPDAAKPLLENVARAVEKGTGLGSDVSGGDNQVRSGIALSFINRDLQAFRNSMSVVKEKDYSSLYDDAAMTFGLNCGLIPLYDLDSWIDAFREYFTGKQHYFKVVYRAIDKENYDHALKMAEATARFFPDEKLLVEEANFVRNLIPQLKAQKAARPSLDARVTTLRPAA